MRHTYGSSISPDGHAIAYIVREAGYPHAVQRQLNEEGLGEERVVKLPVEGPVTRLLHSPDGKWLAIEAAPHGTERLDTWLVSTDPEVAGATPLRQPKDRKTTLVEWDNNFLAMNAVDHQGVNQARLVNSQTGRFEVLDVRTDSQLVAAENGYGLVRVGPRGNRELLLVGPDGKWRPLLRPDPGATTESGAIIAGASSEKLVAFVLSDHDSEYKRVLRITVHNFVNVEVEEFIGNNDQDIEEFVISDDITTAAVLWNSGGVSSLEVLTLDENHRVHVRRNVELPGMVARGLSISSDGALISVTVEGPGLTPTVEILSTIGGTITPFDQQRTQGILDEEIAGTTTSPLPELVHFTAKDGLELSGWLYLPDSQIQASHSAPREVTPQPAMIFIHGGPELQAKPMHHDIISEVVRAGGIVFLPNLRGSSGSGRALEHAGDRYGRFAAIDDIADAADFLTGAGLADPCRLVVAGRSYGGFMSLMASAVFPDRFAAIIDVCGMTSFETYYRSTEPWLAQAAYPRYGYPYQDAELLRDLSPLLRADSMKAPTLFIHGEMDTNVPPRESGQMRNALDAYGIHTEFLMVPGEGHKFAKPKSRALIADTTVKFLAQIGVLDPQSLYDATRDDQPKTGGLPAVNRAKA